MTMFEGLTTTGLEELIAAIDSQSPLLADDDREFILGCQMAISSGGKLTDENEQRVRKIARSITAAGHNALEGAISIPQVCKDLSGANHMLSGPEKAFFAVVDSKVRSKVPLSAEEVQQLLTIHAGKGF